MSRKALTGGSRKFGVNIQHWADAKDCLVGNCKNIAESARKVER